MPDAIYLAIQQLQQGPGVRSVLDQVADRIATRARYVADRDHLSSESNVVHTSRGIRPKGRSYAQVGISNRTRPQAQTELGEAAFNGPALVRHTVAASRKPKR